MTTKSTQVLFKSEPGGLPTPSNFELADAALGTPDDNQFLVRVQYLSLDPYMRMLEGRNIGKQLVRIDWQ